MSQVFKDHIVRMTKDKVLNLKNTLDNIFRKYFPLSKSFIPELYKDKQDFGDLDYFLLNEIGFDNTKGNNLKNIIIDILQNNGFIVEQSFINDLEVTMLVKYGEEYFHIDIHCISNSYFFNNTYFPYYFKPFFGYYFGIMLRKCSIKFSSKGVKWFDGKEYHLITDSIWKFFDYVDLYWYKGFLEKFKQIETFGDILPLLYKLPQFDYRYYEVNNLKYEEKRKIKRYKVNEKMQNIIMSDKHISNNISLNIFDSLIEYFPEFKQTLENYTLKTSEFIKMKNEKDNFIISYFGNKENIKNILKNDEKLKKIYISLIKDNNFNKKDWDIYFSSYKSYET